MEKAVGRGATRRGRKTEVVGLSLANQMMPPLPFNAPCSCAFACQVDTCHTQSHAALQLQPRGQRTCVMCAYAVLYTPMLRSQLPFTGESQVP
jgi:hypothetical protein